MDPQGSASIATTSATGPAVEGTVREYIVVDSTVPEHTVVERWSFDVSSNKASLFSTASMPSAEHSRIRRLNEIASSQPRALALNGLTWKELKAVLLGPNPVLEELYISDPTSTSAADITEMCRTLSDMLRTRVRHTLRLLDLKRYTLTYEGEILLSGLKYNALEELRLSKWESGVHIADIILSAPRLRKLELRKIRVLDERDSSTLADALTKCTSLESLVLEMVTPLYDSQSDLLLRAVSKLSIISLEVDGVMESTGKFLQDVLSSNQSLKYLAWDSRKLQNMDTNEWSHLGGALARHSSLELFKVLVRWSDIRAQSTGGLQALLTSLRSLDPCVCLYLNSARKGKSTIWYSSSEGRWRESEKLLFVDMKNPIIALHLLLQDAENNPTAVWPDLAKALDSTSRLSSLHLEMGDGLKRTQGSGKELFWKALEKSPYLRFLTIEGGKAEYCPGGWKELLGCLLCRNSGISHLRLMDCDGLGDDVFEQLMDVIRLKSILKTIDFKGTSWKTDGKRKETLIRQALKRNAERASNFSIFDSLKPQSEKDKRKYGRLFLFGSPSKGKTSLRRNITRPDGFYAGLKSKLTPGEKKSNGIKVKMLKDDPRMRVAVWDVPPAWSLLTHQYILFPPTNHAFIFLFVFSPYVKDTSTIKPNLKDCFEKELNEFLLCISSNSQIRVQEVVPEVVVVISCERNYRPETTWATHSVEDFRGKYGDSLVIKNSYTVNTDNAGEIDPVVRCIVESFQNLIMNRMPVVPQFCSQISSELAKRPKHVQKRPVWLAREFDRFCKDRAKEVNSLPPKIQTEVLEAMASHLHDTGIIIKIPNSDRIIVDPAGLINMFLGELVTLGENFIEVESSPVQSMSLKPIFNLEGPSSSKDIEIHLRKFISKYKPLGMNYDRVLKLLNHFSSFNNLVGVNAEHYIPVLEASQRTDVDSRVEPVSCSSSLEDGQEDGLVSIGFRVKCGNPNQTSSSDPHFQVYFRHKVKVREM